jgi:hypothetical protein
MPDRAHAEPMSSAADRLEITQDELIKRADEIFKSAMALSAAVCAKGTRYPIWPAH